MVVADTKTPINYVAGLMAGLEHDKTAKDRLVFLSVEDQQKIKVPLVQRIPFRSFARKNIGFLFAIRHGAQVIFDFDDDNILKDEVIYQLESLPDLNTGNETKKTLRGHALYISPKDRLQVRPSWLVKVPQLHNRSLVFNPFPHMGSSNPDIWPRGFPLEKVRECATMDAKDMVYRWMAIPLERVAVVQAVCDLDPDVDAVYRLTRPLPVQFDDDPKSATRLLIPPGKYTPYNAQATLHTGNAFWGLFLPYTVTGRVTDIWRSYFTERILVDLQLAVLYSPPTVLHQRSKHFYLADMQAEDDLYMKTSKLLGFLSTWKGDPLDTCLTSRLEKMYVDLYERDYIGLEDVLAMQDWLSALLDVGYEFPKFSPSITPLLDAMFPAHEAHSQGFSIPPREYNAGGPNLDQSYPQFIASNKQANQKGDENQWIEWSSQVQMLQDLHPELVPSKIRIVDLIMVKDEWPLLRDNILYTGHLIGFENMYIFDGSKDPRSISFLRYARDYLGANVIFSSTSLNELASEMSDVGRMLVKSSDLILKTDADEFMGLLTDTPSCIAMVSATVDEQKLANCTLSPYALSNFLADRNNLQQFHNHIGQFGIDTQMFTTGQDPEQCKPGVSYDASKSKFRHMRWPDYKGIADARSFDTVDLGGHGSHMLHPHAGGPMMYAPVGIFHLHYQCPEREYENIRNVLIGHGYIAVGDSKEVQLEKLKNLSGPNLCKKSYLRISSFHKVLAYAQHLQGCPVVKTTLFGSDGVNATMNLDYRSFRSFNRRTFIC